MSKTQRAVLETDDQGRLKAIPILPPRSQVEVTFLVLDPGTIQTSTMRMPPPELAGLTIQGDITSPVIDEDDWGFMK